MAITKRLARFVADYDSQQSLGSRLRGRRIGPLLSLIRSVSAAKGQTSVIDIGGTEQYWGIVPPEFLAEHAVRITIVNVPGSRQAADHGPFTFVRADGCDLSVFADNSFDIAHSNSVIEHVGDWSRMVLFAREVRRVARYYFVQTPNYWFPVEPHCMTPFFHWLPRPARLWLVANFALGNWHRARNVDEAVRTVESARLLTKAMVRELFADAEIATEWFALMPKSFVAVRQQPPS